MSRPAPTWLHASGYRFLTRRIECALLGIDLRSVGGPLRFSAHALVCGCALALAVSLGCACLALLRPQPGLGEARIVMSSASGELYVRVGDTWHPALNLASARLVVSTNTDPVAVPEAAIAGLKRGASVGIPGAPQSLAPPLAPNESHWTSCDDVDGAATTVFVGPVAEGSIRRLQPDQAVLAASGPGSPVYLLYRGRRAAVDLADRAVSRALGLTGQVVRATSPTLLDAVPEASPIAVPRIRGAGGPAGAWLPGYPIGSVVQITRASGDEHYVVLGTGVQRITRFVADLLRPGDPRGTAQANTVASDALRGVPITDSLPVSGLPDEAPSPIFGATALCAMWAPGNSGAAVTLLTRGPPGLPVRLAQADGRGPAVDAVHLPPGRSAYVIAQSLGGNGPATGARYLVTDTGVRFPIHDDEAARALGLPATATPAPWPVLAALPCGPELSRQQASVTRDVIASGPP